MSLINYGNLQGLRDSFRIRTGLIEAGASGDARLNTVLNLANRQLWMDAPSVFQKQEIRLILQPAIGTGFSEGAPTLDVSPLDQRVFRFTQASSTVSLFGSGGIRALMVGRWIDITDTDGNIHTRRITATANSVTTNDDWGDGITAHSLIMVDRPWANATDEGLTFRIYTLDYPLPADVTDISNVIRNPETDGYEVLSAVYPAELDRLRMGHWAEEGLPTAYSDGEFTQLRSPHDTVSVSINNTGLDSDAWGFDDDENENLGQASSGTFSYCYCLVRGRLSSPSRVLMGSNPDVESDFQRPPFYISAPSKPSAQIETTWGEGGINVVSIDQDWPDHRTSQMGGTVATALGPLSGLEKWWFRACHSSNGDNPAGLFEQEPDGVFRLIRIQNADEIGWLDKGQYDPTDYSFTLKEFTGHKSVRFDKTPGDVDTEVLVRANVRPDILRDDNDILPFPPGAATDAVIHKAAEYISERDGDMTKAQYYGSLYEKHVNKLREKDGWSSTKKTGFGDGMTPGSQRSWTMSPKIREFGS